MKLNEEAVKQAKKLIKEGKITFSDEWQHPEPELENEYIEKKGWDEYGKWFLAIDEEANEETKARYKFPYSNDFETINRRGVIAIKQRASQYDYKEIFEVASELLEMIDKVEKVVENVENSTSNDTTLESSKQNYSFEKHFIKGIAYQEKDNLNGVIIPVKEIDFSYYEKIGKPILFNHNSERVIGNTLKLEKRDNSIYFEGVIYNVDNTFYLVKEKAIKGVSIGLTKSKDKWVMVELSITATPAVDTAQIFETNDKFYFGGVIYNQNEDFQMETFDVFVNDVNELQNNDGGVDIKKEEEVKEMNVKIENSINDNKRVNFATIQVDWGDVKQIVKDITQEPSILTFLGTKKMDTIAEYHSFFSDYGNVYGETNQLDNVSKSDVVMVAKYFYAGKKVKPSEMATLNQEKLQTIVENLRKSILYGIEKTIITGDSNATSEPTNYWDGLVKLATNAGNVENITTLNLQALKRLLKKLGAYAVNPSNLGLIVDINGFDKITDIPEVITVDKIGNDAYIRTGVIASILGIPVYTTSVSLTNNNKTSIILVNKNLVSIGVYQDVSVKDMELVDGSVAVISSAFVGFAGLGQGVAVGVVDL